MGTFLIQFKNHKYNVNNFKKIQASYGMKHRFGNVTDFNPYFGTDYGICSIIKPQLAFNSDLDNVPYWEKIFGKYNWNVTKGTVL